MGIARHNVFSLGFGQVWCQNIREQGARMRAKTDPHSSGEWRVNGTVQNFDQFGTRLWLQERPADDACE